MKKYRNHPILFDVYPSLAEKIPWIPLGTFPTPIKKMKKLGKLLGAPALYVKREDKSGKLYGGNKVRKLEFSLADALDKNKKRIVTFGGVGSNHVLATTIYSNRLGLETCAFLIPQPPSPFVSRNIRAYSHYGTKIFFLKDKNEILKRGAELSSLLMGGGYFLPPGGSNVRGVLGFVDCAFEIKRQIEEKELPEPERIFVAGGSGGTLAGLILGAKLAGLKAEIIGVRVADKWMVNKFTVSALANSTARYLRSKDRRNIPSVKISREEVILNEDFFGDCYGSVTGEAREAMKLMEKYEGIHLENTYTGKAFAAVLEAVRKEPERVTLFINTYNSVDIYSELPDACDMRPIPPPMRRYVFDMGEW